MSKYLKEFFSIHDIWIMSSMILVSLAIVFPKMGDWVLWLCVVIGVIVYIVAEYLTHRFVFHMKAPKNPFLLKLMKRLHYDHHEEPNDLKLLFLPVWYSSPQLVLLVVIVSLISDNIYYGLATLIGAGSTILYYEWSHYVAHRPYQPKTAWGKWMKKLHILHHFKNENYWYGVTNPSMDYLFGTMKDGKDVPKSDIAKKLGTIKANKDINM